MFTKEPRTASYVSWHQDLRYWGLSGDAVVLAWVALGRVTEAHGCMRFVPGSHRLEILEHRDTYDGENFLARGQEAVYEVDESCQISDWLRRFRNWLRRRFFGDGRALPQPGVPCGGH